MGKRPRKPGRRGTPTGDWAAKARLKRSIETIRGLLGAGRVQDAVRASTEAQSAFPDEPDVWRVSAEIALRMGATGEAARLLERVVERAPRDAEAWGQLAGLRSRLNDPAGAAEMIGRASAIRPDDAALQRRLFESAQSLNNAAIAAECARRWARAAPDDRWAAAQLANALAASGLAEESASVGAASTQIWPDDLNAHLAVFVARLIQGRHADVRAAAERIGALHGLSGELAMRAANVRLSSALFHRDEPEDVLASARGVAATYPVLSPRTGADTGGTHRGEPVTIGFVSPDVCEHAVARFLEPILEHRDRARVRCVLYHTGGHRDAVTTRLVALADDWTAAASMTSNQLADHIASQGVDVLVDLAGYTNGTGVAAFRARPAPVQATFIGFPATLGMDEIDVRIVDSLTDPPGEADRFASERLVRIDPCFLCYQPSDDAPEPGPVPALGAGHVTFGVFNRLQKASDRVVELWARVLGAVPGSRLVMKAPPFAEEATRAWWLERWASLGVATDRITLLARTERYTDHLTALASCDIALDTFPYNGTTTTCEAAWMGVPTMTRVGRSHHARVGLSLLSAMGLRDFACEHDDDFVDRAVTLAGDLNVLGELRARLRSTVSASPLCDSPAYVARLTEALEIMVRDAHARPIRRS